MRIVIALLLVLFYHTSFGCSCDHVGILQNQKASKLVFTGRVIKIEEITTIEKTTKTNKEVKYRRYKYTFKIDSFFKGKRDYKAQPTVDIITTGLDTDCGNRFKEGERYLVYSYLEDHKLGWGLWDQKADKKFLTTNLCTRTRRDSILNFYEKLLLLIT